MLKHVLALFFSVSEQTKRMGRDIRRAQGEPFLLSPHRSVVIWNETKISTIEEGNMQYQMIPERVAPPLPPKTRQPKWAILTLCLVIAICK